MKNVSIYSVAVIFVSLMTTLAFNNCSKLTATQTLSSEERAQFLRNAPIFKPKVTGASTENIGIDASEPPPFARDIIASMRLFEEFYGMDSLLDPTADGNISGDLINPFDILERDQQGAMDGIPPNMSGNTARDLSNCRWKKIPDWPTHDPNYHGDPMDCPGIALYPLESDVSVRNYPVLDPGGTYASDRVFSGCKVKDSPDWGRYVICSGIEEPAFVTRSRTRNGGNSPWNVGGNSFDNGGDGDGDGDPLLVGVTQANLRDHLKVSKISEGIEFDLLGKNHPSAEHKTVKTGWFSSPDFRWLVIPDAFQNSSTGIDELFGDNTNGPYGAYSPSGFHALAKYDGTDAKGERQLRPRDKVIDSGDAIYSYLRLWWDKNSDGKMQSTELTSLREHGISALDLHVDTRFYEEDEYGNKITFKALVIFDGGEMSLMTDIWLKYEL